MELAAPIPVQPRDAFLRELPESFAFAARVMLAQVNCIASVSRCGAASCPGTTALGGTASQGIAIKTPTWT